jgi:peptidyl-prolyl cis-trans isomerase C
MVLHRARSTLALTALSCALLGLAGCNHEAVQDRPPQPGDVAVAKVQGQTVWASDVKREAVAEGLISEGEPLDTSSDLFRRVLDGVVDEKLLAAEAVKRGLDKKPLAERRLAAARERILGDMLVESAVDSNIREDSVQQLYDEQVKLSKQAEEFHARLILVKTRPEADAIGKLLATGASFEALAMDRSTDQATRFSGGDLGYFTTDVMPAYAEALKNAKAGETVGPVQTENGFALLRVEDRRQEKPLTLEAARPQIRRFLTYDEVRKLLLDLRKRSKIAILIKGDPLAVPGAPREPASAPPGALAAPLHGPVAAPSVAAPAADLPRAMAPVPAAVNPATPAASSHAPAKKTSK